jgi:hypothetical protein
MKKYVEVFWTPFSPNDVVMQNLFVPPKPLLGILSIERRDAAYLKCPAFQEVVKNEFVIPAPFDLNITINKEERAVYTDRFGQNFYDSFISNRGAHSPSSNPYMVTLPPYYVFYSKDDVSIEVKDVSLMASGSTSNVKVIPGGFNISKWIRPLEFAVEVVDASKPIAMREGDPLYAIRFITPNNVPVKLTRVEESQDLKNMSRACTGVKHYIPHIKLDKAYELAASYLSLFFKK